MLWLHLFILSGVVSPLISSSILGTYRPGEFLFQYPIIFPFHTVHGVLKSRIVKWFAIPFSSGPHSVRYDLNHIPYDYTVEVRNRFKGLDLIDRVPDELWMEVHDIVQETGINTIPMEKKCKKARWLSGEALQIAVKRRDAKSKREKERYSHLIVEFQRMAKER